jgi:iron(III) transport system ATP-binding protein
MGDRAPERTAPAMLVVEALRRTFPARQGGPPVRALDGVSIAVEQGELFALLGPSGCGKTTLLQSIAGLETPDEGRIRIGDRAVSDADTGVFVPANRRAIGMVFQSYAIWPHMTVFENVAFPLRHGTVPRPDAATVRRRVMDALSVVKLADFAGRPAPHLSGGQQQRVALARAIVAEPRLLLLDEPLSNLDARLRDAMRVELRQLVKSLGITAVFVTHDQVEAMGMADRIALMRAGRIVHLGAPDEVYFRPADAFAAGFMGQGNVLDGVVVRRDGRTVVATAVGDLPVADDADLAPGGAVTVVVRPHAVDLVDGAAGDATDGADGLLAGTVARDSLLGTVRELEVDVRGTVLRVQADAFEARPAGTRVTVRVRPGRFMVLPRGAAADLAATATGPGA